MSEADRPNLTYKEYFVDCVINTLMIQIYILRTLKITTFISSCYSEEKGLHLPPTRGFPLLPASEPMGAASTIPSLHLAGEKVTILGPSR